MTESSLQPATLPRPWCLPPNICANHCDAICRRRSRHSRKGEIREEGVRNALPTQPAMIIPTELMSWSVLTVDSELCLCRKNLIELRIRYSEHRKMLVAIRFLARAIALRMLAVRGAFSGPPGAFQCLHPQLRFSRSAPLAQQRYNVFTLHKANNWFGWMLFRRSPSRLPHRSRG